MKWISDPSRRFARRPLYERSEIEDEMAVLIERFSTHHNISVSYPLTIEILGQVVDSMTEDYDSACDLSAIGEDVEGATKFSYNARPKVMISSSIQNENRRKMTIAHEIGHVHLHNCLYQLDSTLELFLDLQSRAPVYCKRETIVRGRDWMEWQASYAAGAILMPKALVSKAASQFFGRVVELPISQRTEDESRLVDHVASALAVSNDAARVRLIQLGYLEPHESLQRML